MPVMECYGGGEGEEGMELLRGIGRGGSEGKVW